MNSRWCSGSAWDVAESRGCWNQKFILLKESVLLVYRDRKIIIDHREYTYYKDLSWCILLLVKVRVNSGFR